MNERILEIAKQAGLKFPSETDLSLQEKKFAELLIRECILTIQMGITRDGQTTEKYLRSVKHLKDIKKHFGVEE